ncbi:hypothetical protein BSZ18_38955 [Bradyrhizobium canariense]|uniref:Uncharacterized protein n=1 Tax=Bradyrhizobium canariense TaxID=255045 RepID=A0A1X3GNI4_9BRAD|nr:hypothetical protein BSZ25_12675 [Bradyrhizobium canariense]OSI94043.1 hypothetical protein BSZ24_11430 [Bradyrhizobium canariense]OSJ01784.1 hypothetical protein BSZ18_38955 [Bradyrhizobium canariense]OSJ07154.1 hypothetical protein BSZ16_08570 [Bradyrhizobium canariense]
MSTYNSRRSSRKSDTDLLYSEIVLVCLIVWYHWSWDAALITGVCLTAVFVLISRLSSEDSNFVCALLGVAWGSGALFLLLTAKASLLTCAVFVPLAGMFGYAGHLMAIEYLRGSAPPSDAPQ